MCLRWFCWSLSPSFPILFSYWGIKLILPQVNERLCQVCFKPCCQSRLLVFGLGMQHAMENEDVIISFPASKQVPWMSVWVGTTTIFSTGHYCIENSFLKVEDTIPLPIRISILPSTEKGDCCEICRLLCGLHVLKFVIRNIKEF